MDTTEPTEIYAGDSAEWQKTLSGYPASGGWEAHYYYRNESQYFDVNGVADGDAFIFTVLTTDSAAWLAGTYHWQLFATNPTDSLRKFISEGDLLVKQDPSTQQPSDSRTYNERVLESINALVAGRKDVDEYSIGGRSIKKMPMTDLLEWQDKFARKVSAERRGNSVVFVGAAFQNPS